MTLLTGLQLKSAGNTRVWCQQGTKSYNYFPPYRLNKWLSMQIISTAVWQARVSQAWLVPKELTCKYIVVVVDVVQFDPFIQHVKLICSQHLALPVRVTWVMTDHRSDTYKSHLKIHRPLRLPLICMGYEQKPLSFRQRPLVLPAGAVMMSQFRWVTGMFLVAREQDRGKPEGPEEKDASLSPWCVCFGEKMTAMGNLR